MDFPASELSVTRIWKGVRRRILENSTGAAPKSQYSLTLLRTDKAFLVRIRKNVPLANAKCNGRPKNENTHRSHLPWKYYDRYLRIKSFPQFLKVCNHWD